LNISKILKLTAKLMTANIYGTDYQFEKNYITLNALKLLRWRQFCQHRFMPQPIFVASTNIIMFKEPAWITAKLCRLMQN